MTSLLLARCSAFANDVTVTGSIKYAIKLSPDQAVFAERQNSRDSKVIQLMRVQLSSQEKNLLKTQASSYTHKSRPSLSSTFNASLYPQYVQLGMNNVPVLDQGVHGTCTTFAITAVLDAAMKKGDYISQVCNLQLGNYLEQKGDSLSGWDGSHADYVLGQIAQYGIVNKNNQRKFGCGGYKEYPKSSSHNPSSFIDPDTFTSMSETILGEKVNWETVFQNNPNANLNEVKEALNAGNRLAFAVLLPSSELGTAGAVGKHNTWFVKDTWVLTPEVLKGLNHIEAAHEMIITGYDDEAVAIDNHGLKHKGLLTLRNSWGSDVGDYGQYYMSYDYFKLLAYDLTRFYPVIS